MPLDGNQNERHGTSGGAGPATYGVKGTGGKDSANVVIAHNRRVDPGARVFESSGAWCEQHALRVTVRQIAKPVTSVLAVAEEIGDAVQVVNKIVGIIR